MFLRRVSFHMSLRPHGSLALRGPDLDYGKHASLVQSVDESTVLPVKLPTDCLRIFLVLPTTSSASIYTICSPEVYSKPSSVDAKSRLTPISVTYFGCGNSQLAQTIFKRAIDEIVAC
jgi:hypothetical protein